MNILEVVWDSGTFLHVEQDLPPVAGLLNSLLAAPVVALSTGLAGGDQRALALMAGTEVMPGASLADVLFEEFSVEISEGTVVLVLPDNGGPAEGASSQEMGTVLGEILVQVSGLSASGHYDKSALHAGLAGARQSGTGAAEGRAGIVQ